MPWETVLQVISPIVASLLGAGGIVAVIVDRKNKKAQASYVESQTAINYVTIANGWIDRLEAKVKSLEAKIDELEKTVEMYEQETHRLTIELRDEREKNGNIRG